MFLVFKTLINFAFVKKKLRLQTEIDSTIINGDVQCFCRYKSLRLLYSCGF